MVAHRLHGAIAEGGAQRLNQSGKGERTIDFGVGGPLPCALCSLAMQIGALGDIHGAFETVHIIMRRHADVPLWVCVGDVASNDGEYFTPEAPLHFIKGNNEDFDVIADAMKGHPPAPTLHYLTNGGPHIVGPWSVAALLALLAAQQAGAQSPPHECRPH